jgi:hypothetical protein
MGSEESRTLFEVADSQKGYFTSRQAVEAGIRSSNHTYHVHRGNWIRQWRGIYRLSDYPFHDDEHYALWAVWSMNRRGEMQGVYSHDTALSIYELSDVNPAKIHMTVPPGFRRHGEVPPVLVLHYSRIGPSECEDRGGYKVTRPFRAIADLVRAKRLSDEFIIQAVKEGLQSGKLTRAQFEELTVMPHVGKSLRQMLEGHDAER